VLLAPNVGDEHRGELLLSKSTTNEPMTA
jgi:hypothetical protein